MRLILSVIIALTPFAALAHSWYSGACCNDQDCAEIQITARDGVYYWTSHRWPEYSVSLPVDSDKIKPSQDGNFHGCERREYKMVDGISIMIGVEARCLYVPPSI